MTYKDPADLKAWREKNKEKVKAKEQEWREKNKEEMKKYQQDWYQQNKEKVKAKEKERYQENKEQKNEYQVKKYKNCKQHAYDSITTGNIIDQHMWDEWCNKIKNGSEEKHSYSEDFTNDVMFEMMIQGCFYCGDVATTIDRIDSKLDHTLKNCIGCCPGCNVSKGAADHNTFIRKAYYRARGTYYDDDTNIWYEHKNKPVMSVYKRKKVPFELSVDEWDKLVVGECAYCHRSPTTWFGVDRKVPSRGYISDNVESCCWDCNNDKAKDDIKTMYVRNDRIAQRMDDGELVIGDRKKVILHQGTHPSSMTVCTRGKVYETQGAAAKAIKTSQSYVSRYISNGKEPEIFAVTKEFYDFAIENNLENITKNMFVAFDHFYTNVV